MKYFVAALVLLVGVSALPQNPFKWHKASPMNIHQMKTKNLYAQAVESTFYPKKNDHQKFVKQTPSFYKPSSFQADDCSLENGKDGRVVNGEEANPNQFPWLAAVYCTDGGWFCTGSFISEDWVLTAGHCVAGCSTYNIVAGAHSLSSNEPDKIEIASSDSILHENYDSGALLNDIGLVKLPEPVPLSDKVRLSCLPTHADEGNDFTGELTTITGWGKLSDSDFTAADKVHFAKDRPIIENTDCADTYGSIITDSHLCIDTETGSGPEGGIGVCNGDSGGPLNLQTADPMKYLQVGVTSFVSSGGCENTYPHGFTRVTSFLTWITDNTGIAIP